MLKKINRELFFGWSLFEKAYLFVLLAMQIGVYISAPDNLMGMIAGISGVLCVVFVAKGKISNYFFGLIQITLYLILSYENRFYGEIILNIFYFITQFYGIYIWSRHMKKEITINNEIEVVKAKGLSLKQWLLTSTTVIIAWYGFGLMLQYFGSQRPFIDSIATSLSVVAQILMTYRYKEQWLLWILVNIFSIILWIGIDWSMVAMWIAFLVNSMYGYLNWRKLAK